MARSTSRCGVVTKKSKRWFSKEKKQARWKDALGVTTESNHRRHHHHHVTLDLRYCIPTRYRTRK